MLRTKRFKSRLLPELDLTAGQRRQPASEARRASKGAGAADRYICVISDLKTEKP